MGFPDKKEIDRALKKLEKVEGTLALSLDATPLEKLRFDICQKFLKYKKSKAITGRELAETLGVDEAKVSKILRHRIDDFSTDRLIDLYSRLDSKLEVKVS